MKDFKIAHSKWLKEGEKLTDVLETELKKDSPNLTKIRNAAERLIKHLRLSAEIEKDFL